MLQPRRVYAVVLPLLVVSFALSGVGPHKTRSDGGLYWVAAGGWAVFFVTFILTVAYTIFTVIRITRRRMLAER